MNWLRNLLGRPAEKKLPPVAPSGAGAAPARPAPPAVDLPRLRHAVALAATAEERSTRERELGRGLAQLHQSPAAEDAAETWLEAVCHAEDKATAREWSRHLQGDAAFAEVAKRGRFSELRLEAARHIMDTDFLERVAEQSRDRDKGVYRYCTETLKRRRQAAERARGASELALTVMGLLEAQPLPLSRLLDAEKELRSLGEGGDELAECARLLEQARTRVREEADAARQLQALQGQTEALLEEMQSRTWPEAQRIEAWRSRADELAQAAAQSPPWLSGQAAMHAIGQAGEQIAARFAEIAAESERARACADFLDTIPAGEVDAERIATWQALEKPANPLSLSLLESRWRSLQPQVEASPEVETVAEPAPEPAAAEAAPPRRQVDMAVVTTLLDTLDQALEDGHLAEAEAAQRRIEQSLAGSQAPGALGRRLARAHAQVSRLRGWARWSTDQAREHLIEAAEALLAAEPDVDERARAVPALRKEWKGLDAHAPASKAQWERFDTALEQAYQPVAEHRAQEAERHDAARAAREALLAEWEAWLGGMVWEHADLKVVQARRQEILAEWRSAPPASFRDERQLRKRLDTLVAAIDERVTDASQREIARREELVASIEALREAPDIGRAIAQAKSAQERWREQATSVKLARNDEQALWQRFRAACDAVFARRDAQRDQQTAQREARRQARQAAMAEFEAGLASESIADIERALATFRGAWDQAEGGARERGGNGPDTQARDASQRAHRRIEELRAAKHRARFELMARKAELARSVEAAVLGGSLTEEQMQDAQQAWNALPKLAGKAEKILGERFEAAPGITSAYLEVGRETREKLLLDLEIALGLPSPDALTETRRARQIGSLKDRFKGGGIPAADAEAMLVQWYATAASPDPAQDERIAAIVRRLAEPEPGAGG